MRADADTTTGGHALLGRRIVVSACLVGLVAADLSCRRDSSDDSDGEPPTAPRSEPFTVREISRIETLSPLAPIAENPTNRVSQNDRAAHFGRFLFFDARLSGDGSTSCASCHRPNHGFSVPTRLGHGIDSTPRHPPSLLNTAVHRWYDWDGKADSLWAQAARPLENPREQGTSRTAVVRTVASNPELRRAYESVFDELGDFASEQRFPPEARPVPNEPESAAHRAWTSMTEADRRSINRVFTNVTKAIAAYEEKLVAADAPFDRYVEGLQEGDAAKLDAISPAAKRGLALFIGEAKCINCHNGPAFTDKSFHNLGLGPRPWLPENDTGRWRGVKLVQEAPFNAKGRYSDRRDGRRADWITYLKRTPEARGQFKTPSLRNVERTAPYMHGGHFDTLEEVVRFYSTLSETTTVGHREEMLEPLGLSQREIDDLVAFLRSLTGERPPAKLLGPPDSPIPP